MRIDGATALVSGGNRGLGQVLVRQLLAMGALAGHGGGSIVNVLSIASWSAFPVMGSYCASKAASWSLTNVVREEPAERGTLVVAVHCGYIDTDMARDVGAPKNTPESIAGQTLAAVEAGDIEVLADEHTRSAKAALTAPPAGQGPGRDTARAGPGC